jgi:hypothetical protein
MFVDRLLRSVRRRCFALGSEAVTSSLFAAVDAETLARWFHEEYER